MATRALAPRPGSTGGGKAPPGVFTPVDGELRQLALRSNGGLAVAASASTVLPFIAAAIDILVQDAAVT